MDWVRVVIPVCGMADLAGTSFGVKGGLTVLPKKKINKGQCKRDC